MGGGRFFSRAIGQHQAGELEAAVDSYRRHIKANPNDSSALANLGIALKQLGHVAESVETCRRAVSLDPQNGNGWNNLGIGLIAGNQAAEAVEAYRKAVSIDPEFFEAWSNLGIALTALGRLPEAVECFGKALSIAPDYTEALVQLIHQSQQLCRWEDLDRPLGRLVSQIRKGSADVNPFALLSICADPGEMLSCARNYSAKVKIVAQKAAGNVRFTHDWKKHGRKRIGYLSADFHAHATAFLAVQLFESHDRERFETYAFSYGPDDDGPMRGRLTAAFDHFVNLRGLSLKDAACLIHAKEIDLLVDLKGYTHGAWTQIMALRPSPVQVSYLGYPGTMGADFIDHIIVDRFIVPPGDEKHYSEKCLFMPGSYQVNDAKRAIIDDGAGRKAHHLPEDGFVFCSFNQAAKITPGVFTVWMDLLKAVKGSVLWLLAFNPYAEANLRRYAAGLGVAPERLIFAPKLPLERHLARYRLADLFLDTFPCNAHTTASDALWGGCPLVTVAGRTFASRVAGSLLNELGFRELIAGSLEEYRKLALSLAADAERLGGIRRRLAEAAKTSRLFDGAAFARDFEALLDRL